MSKIIPNKSGFGYVEIADPNTITDLNSPAVTVFDISPSANPIRPVPREIYITGAGDVTFRLLGDTVSQTRTMAADSRLPYRVEYITAATATGIKGVA